MTGGNMANKKWIPCRVCGKLFQPCSYCQSHTEVFRWRNFACSYECASKYLQDTIAYRQSQHPFETTKSLSEHVPKKENSTVEMEIQQVKKKDMPKKNFKKDSFEILKDENKKNDLSNAENKIEQKIF